MDHINAVDDFSNLEMIMKIFTSLAFLISLAGPAAAVVLGAAVPGPEMSAGVVGMTLAAGVVYLIKRRGKRS